MAAAAQPAGNLPRATIAPRPRNRAVLELRAADGRLLRAVVFTPGDADSRARAVARLRAEAVAWGHVVVAPERSRRR